MLGGVARRVLGGKPWSPRVTTHYQVGPWLTCALRALPSVVWRRRIGRVLRIHCATKPVHPEQSHRASIARALLFGAVRRSSTKALTCGCGPRQSAPIHVGRFRDAEVVGSNPAVPNTEGAGQGRL